MLQDGWPLEFDSEPTSRRLIKRKAADEPASARIQGPQTVIVEAHRDTLDLFQRSGRLKAGEVAGYEEHVHKPEGKPDRRNDFESNQEQDQTWRQEHRGVTQKPEAIGSPSLHGPFGVTHPSAQRTPVVMQRREHE